VEREERRAAQRSAGRPAPAGLLPGAAVDGKALRGARTKAGRVFLVGAIAHVSGVVLGQRQVPDKRGEGTVVHELLAPLDVAGMVLTLDALHTSRPVRLAVIWFRCSTRSPMTVIFPRRPGPRTGG
jgi:hypothetical protein